MPTPQHSIRMGTRTWDLGTRTHVIGIVNITRDSFSDGGHFIDPDAAVAHGLDLLRRGADGIDVGGESTRPGAEPVPAAEEIDRVVPVIRRLRNATDRPISIDTYKHEVARAAIEAGADWVNDISGFTLDPALAITVADTGVPVILGHLRGTPRTMQAAPHYEDPVTEVMAELGAVVGRAREAGIDADRILIDPGIGFGKRLEDNLALLAGLGRLHDLGRPVVIGTSRKGFIGTLLDRPVGERLEGTLASETVAILHGAHILRTHDVTASLRAARIADAVRQAAAAPATGRRIG